VAASAARALAVLVDWEASLLATSEAPQTVLQACSASAVSGAPAACSNADFVVAASSKIGTSGARYGNQKAWGERRELPYGGYSYRVVLARAEGASRDAFVVAQSLLGASLTALSLLGVALVSRVLWSHVGGPLQESIRLTHAVAWLQVEGEASGEGKSGEEDDQPSDQPSLAATRGSSSDSHGNHGNHGPGAAESPVARVAAVSTLLAKKTKLLTRFVDVGQVRSAVYHHAPDRTLLRDRHVTVLRASLGELDALCGLLAPEDVGAIVTAFVTYACDALRETRGILLDLHGGELAAVWNGTPEEEQTDHAARACRAAMLMRRSAELVRDALGEGMPAPMLHAGVVTGRVRVGATGTGGRVRWACVGGATSEAGRLLELSRAWRCRVLLSHATREALRGEGLVRTVDVYATPEGAVMPAYELWADDSLEASLDERELAALYDQGFQAYISHDMAAARRCFSHFLEAIPGDIPARLHLERARNVSSDADHTPR